MKYTFGQKVDAYNLSSDSPHRQGG